MPKQVLEKDTAGIMDQVEMSQLVRDLCRQITLDREAWKEVVSAIQDHAKRIDEAEHELLQTNDQVGNIVDGANQIYYANQKLFKAEVQTAMDGVKAGVNQVDQNLRKTVAEAQAEFAKDREQTQALIADLHTKFATMDTLIAELGKQDADIINELSKVKQPFLDPSTGKYAAAAAAVPNFYLGTPARANAEEDPTGAAAGAASAAAAAANRSEYPQPTGPAQALGGQFFTPAKEAPRTGGPTTTAPVTGPQGPQGQGLLRGFPQADPHDSLPQGPPRVFPQEPPRASQDFHPGVYGHFHGAQPGYYEPPGIPQTNYYAQVPGARRLYYDSKIFESKFAQETRNQFNGGKDGASWRVLIRGYIVGKLPMAKWLLQWAEDYKAVGIPMADVNALAARMEEDPIVINHLLWAFFNINLVNEAREIFCNVEDSHGLEVWRRICNKINDRGERRRDELYEHIHHPKGTTKCEDVARVLEEWDTNQRLYREAGGEPLRDEEKKRIARKIIPEILANQLILQTQDFTTWSAMTEYIKEKARLIAVNVQQSKPVHALEPEVDVDELVDMTLEDAVEAMGEHATSENIMALVVKKQQKRMGGAGARRGRDFSRRRDEPRKPGGAREPGSKARCTNCGKTGHTRQECRAPKLDSSKRPCFTCGEPGHMAKDCPKKTEDAKAIEAEGDEEEPACMLIQSDEEETWEPVRGGAVGRVAAAEEGIEVTNTFEVIGEESDSDSDGPGPMVFSSDEEPTLEIDGDDDDDSEDSDDEIGMRFEALMEEYKAEDVIDTSRQCCRYQCNRRGKKCREDMVKRFFDLVISSREEEHAEEESKVFEVPEPPQDAGYESEEEQAEEESTVFEFSEPKKVASREEVPPTDEGVKATAEVVRSGPEATWMPAGGATTTSDLFEPLDSKVFERSTEETQVADEGRAAQESVNPNPASWRPPFGFRKGCEWATGAAELGASRQRARRLDHRLCTVAETCKCCQSPPADKTLSEVSPIKKDLEDNEMVSENYATWLDCQDAAASDVPNQRAIQDMEAKLDNSPRPAVARAGRAPAYDVRMASWMSPADDEVPVTERTKKWLEAIVQSTGGVEGDYHPMSQEDLITAQAWEDEEVKWDSLDRGGGPDEEDGDEYVQAMLKSLKRLHSRFGEPLLGGIGEQCNERENQVSVTETDPRPGDLECPIWFLDAEEFNELNVADTEELEFMEEPFEAALDSGAGEHVVHDDSCPTYQVEESAGSRMGQRFTTAGGGKLPNRGQVKLNLRADNGKRGRDLRMTFQVAKVTKPLLSVSKICDAGYTVKFTSEMATVEDKAGKVVCRFMRRKGLYVATMKLRNPNFKGKPAGFPRPDAK